jgi:hypothetical protein
METEKLIKVNERFVRYVLEKSSTSDKRAMLAQRDLRLKFLYLSDKFYELQEYLVLRAHYRAVSKVKSDVRSHAVDISLTSLEQLAISYGKKEMWFLKYEQIHGRKHYLDPSNASA